MNPIIFSIGNFDIKWYSIFILLSIIIGVYLIEKEANRFKISNDFIINMCFWTLICALICARLYYVIFNWSYYSANQLEILQIWKGGLAIHGGIIGGFIAMLIYCKKYKVKLFLMTDIVAPALILGQAIGRWGNFFNSEAHGAATTLEKLTSLNIPNFIIEGMYINGVYYTPTFLYESLWCLLGFIILIIMRRTKYNKVAQLTSVYLMWYSIGRFFIEKSRTDSLMYGGFKVAQIISILLFLIGLITIAIQTKKGKFENLYQEEISTEQSF